MISAVDNINGQQWTTISGATCISVAVFLTIYCSVAWVTQAKHPKGAKDEVKQARRAATRSRGPGPKTNPTTRLRNSCTPRHKNRDCYISGTKRAIRDPLVSKQLEQNSEYEEEEKIGFLKQAQSRPVMPQPRSRAPEGP